MEALTSESTTDEVSLADAQLAILPLGATEQHSSHLPLCTDTLLAEAVAGELGRRLGAFCLPALPYSISHMHRGCKGTFWLSNDTLRKVLGELALGVRASGFSEFLILNGHGGNALLPSVVQDLNLEIPELLSFSLDYYGPFATFAALPLSGDLIHADETETSLVLHLRPDLVQTDKIRDNPEALSADALRYDAYLSIASMLHTGSPSKASAATGKHLFEHVVNELVAVIARQREAIYQRRNLAEGRGG